MPSPASPHSAYWPDRRWQAQAGCNVWSLAAACVFGAGIWSLHFVAMLAFMPTMPITYDVQMTAFSIVIAIAGAWVTFTVWRWPRSRLLGGAVSGILLGGTVSAMHYCGIAAMRPPGQLIFDWAEVGASVCVGMASGVLAMVRANAMDSLGRRIEVCALMALSICGVHFTGMAALTIALGSPSGNLDGVSGSVPLALAVGSVSIVILLVSLAATLVEQHLGLRTTMELRRMRLLSDLSREVMVIHRNGQILEVNEAGSRLFGRRIDELIGSRVLDLFAAEDVPKVARAMRHDTGQLEVVEATASTVAGKPVPVEISANGIDYEGKPACAMAIRDMSDRKRNEEQIRHLAHHDALTDLPNRFLLRDRLTHALDEAARTGDGVAVLYLDLDRFKPVNDLLGHAGGDALLVQVSKRLRAELGPVDTLARVGGDEFVIVSPVGTSPQKASALAVRLIEALSRPFEILGREVAIGTSIGIALYPADGGSQETLMQSADTALYRVKVDGRGSFRLYEPKMDAHLQDQLRLDQDLRHAVDRGELELHYQPILNCATGEVDGFEALVRWRHPERGLIPPMDFIPLAEETLQIGRIGEWVMKAACTAAAAWPKPYGVAVNVSPIQFRQPDFVRSVLAILEPSGLPPHRLEIEVTENVFIEDTGRAIAVLSALREHGIRISLDDFGTGYSSLSYLRSFAFDKLKIDKSFIKGLGQSEDTRMILRTIIGLGHNLGLSVTAEGIETPQQRAMIEALGCDQVQGYLLGRPMRHPPSLAEPPSGAGVGDNVMTYMADRSKTAA